MKYAKYLLCAAVFLALWANQSFADPIIYSISAINDNYTVGNPDESLQTITITGANFGTQSTSSNSVSDFLEFIDNGKFSAGYDGSFYIDTYGLIINSFTDTQIVLGGIDYNDGGSAPCCGILATGDTVNIYVYSGDPVQSNTCTVTVGSGTGCTAATAVPEPASVTLLGSALVGAAALIRRRRKDAANFCGTLRSRFLQFAIQTRGLSALKSRLAKLAFSLSNEMARRARVA